MSLLSAASPVTLSQTPIDLTRSRRHSRTLANDGASPVIQEGGISRGRGRGQQSEPGTGTRIVSPTSAT